MPITSPQPQQHLFQLVVQPIIKSTVGQRESSGKTLNEFVVNGPTIEVIINKLWEKFGGRVKGQAVKRDGELSIITPSVTKRNKVMQFK
ncbi:hypothetical protein JG688_00009878 [Phytophthora aleatoria]|uniref:Uncharacterized protein n=1 Tax=Phytophthora aleatoria TaxID=2496075 RepID=A0A8J5MFB2_9STRA|nr:hypothetical protein JG688_00009878 [Phytophthora aleatoria]